MVRKIPQQVFQNLLLEPLTPDHKKIIISIKKSQDDYGLLTKRKYAYFWTIHNKYLPIVELEYLDTAKVWAGHGKKTSTTRLGYNKKKNNTSRWR